MSANFFSDLYEITLQPLLHLKPLFLLRDGIYSPWHRALRQNLRTPVARSARNKKHTDLLADLHGLPQDLGWISNDTNFGATKPAALLSQIGERIEADLPLLGTEFTHPKSGSLQIEGELSRVYVHAEAKVSPLAFIDCNNGPVVIDARAKVGSFCIVQGPVYIGTDTQLDSCRISNSIAGENCRLGGEIADTIIGDFSNKHHDGFLGHSLVGDWVNLGALTTTSDLKNNYGEIRLTYGDARFETGTIKFGSVIGDYAKTAIGTMLGTGCIIDIGANLFGEPQWSGYVHGFRWGKNETYDREIFLRDAARMMQRRGKLVTPPLAALLKLRD